MAENVIISGILINTLSIFSDDRGAVLHMIRSDSNGYNKFGEVYFSEVLPKSIKAWKKHSLQTQNLSVPVGMIKLVIYDDRELSSTKGNIQTIYLGRPDNYVRVTIPPNLWYGFTSIGDEKSLVVNCADYPHDRDESIVLNFDSHLIPYSWNE
jgi:dTDP-4-dehydrorhamnose 3,5-epimerase